MSSRRPPSNPDDWDDFDIPTWDDSAPSVPSRDYPASGSSSARRSSSRNAYPDPLYDDYEPPAYPAQQPSSRSPKTSQQPPRLSSRVPTRTTRPSRQDPYRDPYTDTANEYAPGDPYPEAPPYEPRAPRASASSQYDLYADPALDMDWEGAAGYDEGPAPRRSRQRTRPARPAVSIPRPAISDNGMVGIVAGGLLSLLIMVGVVWYGMGDLSEVIPWHLNASGDADHWVSNGALWRIPFGSFMALAVGLVLGAFLWKRDRFAARFIITSMCIVQVLAWVAVIVQLW